MKTRGFTLLELLIAMAIIATFLTLVTPRYTNSVDQAKETVLRDNLNTLRKAIDQFRGDVGRYPDRLEELVEKKYLREVPLDPIVENRTSWRITPPSGEEKGFVADVHSSASGSSRDGTSYANW
ncbi:general secretion pathway protein G [Chitinivorax tropicus]|uniref:General secretion pathway protein G n=1 Tax=Chitinivorax tropicus TaxID=714531 RepID=A0A840MVG6_9PROT|nr:prepilin-type N-terminal cleavage/methylation domain-containing protein [Chitinivorax tropicus]MBB5020333.1 general secretion pathway protein G [Chitinivorax tropicus]